METKKNIEHMLISIISKYSKKELSLDTTIEELELESIEFVKIIVEIEKVFGVEVEDDALYVRSGIAIKDFYEYIEKTISI